jgi:AcrR family transcriptional regulator
VTRTSDPVEYARRRDAFLDAAQRLIQVRGYEQMSVDDVLREVGVTKGAFYHYFDSKSALLDAVIARMTEAAIARYDAAAASDLPALEKFEAFWGGIQEYKAEQRGQILGYLRSWLSEDNAVVRDHLRRSLPDRIAPVLCSIVRQGIDEGVFSVTSPEATALVLVTLVQGMNDSAAELFLELDAGSIPVESLEERITAYGVAFERILGAAPGSLKFGDPGTLRTWQRWAKAYREEHP